MRTIFGVMIFTLLLSANDYVIDSETNLMWQDDSDSISRSMNWEEAKKYCNKLSLGKFDDWRLPSIDELKSIVDYEREEIAIKPIFTNEAPSNYWSSSEDVSNFSRAWHVNFHTGYDPLEPLRDRYFARCVRQ